MMTSGGAMPSHSASDGRSKADGKAMGCPFFEVGGEMFLNVRHSRAKGKRWDKKLGNNPITDKIRAYAKQNGNPDILLRNISDGSFMYAQRGLKK